MKILKNLNIRNKLLLGFLIVVALSLPLNWLALVSSHQMDERFSNIVLQSFPRNQVLFEIGKVSLEISRTTKELKIKDGDSAQAEGTIAADQKYQMLAKLEELKKWKEHYDELTIENQKSFLDMKILKSIEDSIILQTLKIIDLQEKRTDSKLIEVEERKLINIQKSLDEIIVAATLQESHFWFEQLKEAQLKSKRLNSIAFITLLIDFCLIVIFSIFISNKIAMPLIALRNVVSQVSAGNYQVRIEDVGEDEIGQLSRDVNHMIDNLESSQRLQIQLMNSEKMASLGQLAAGIAHEINTPIQYVGTNIEFMKDEFSHLLSYCDSLQNKITTHLENFPENIRNDIESEFKKIDLNYLNKEIPEAMQQSMEGIAHVSDIVKAMKSFSHPGSIDKTSADLNLALENTIAVARNEWKYIATIDKDLDPDLPAITCFPNELNQVFLNLIINAAHAIESKNGKDEIKGVIGIHTHHDGNHIIIKISDTGIGIPKNIQAKVFDPFFTTKEVGKGTGHGLTIAHAIVVKKHGGEITFNSIPGEGTTFKISLPV